MTGRRTSIAFALLPLLLAALTAPAVADSAPKAKAKLLPAGQTTLQSPANLSAAATGADSGAELQMLQLQSVVSQRQTAIQTTTNMLNAQNDATKNVIKNIGGGCTPNC